MEETKGYNERLEKRLRLVEGQTARRLPSLAGGLYEGRSGPAARKGRKVLVFF
jgi:hypothetical protein